MLCQSGMFIPSRILSVNILPPTSHRILYLLRAAQSSDNRAEQFSDTGG